MSQSERQWNTFLNEAMGSDQYGQSMGRAMDLYLGMQRNVSEVMGRYFAALNVATRTDVLALGDRLAVIEEHLHSIEAKLGAAKLGDANLGPRPAGSAPAGDSPALVVARPPRTKKPPAA